MLLRAKAMRALPSYAQSAHSADGRQHPRGRTLRPPAAMAPVADGSCNSYLVSTLQDAGAQAPLLTTACLRQSLQLYLQRTPSAAATVDALTTRGGVAPDTLAHDHYAYRTIGLPGLGIKSLADVLHELGYQKQEEGLLFPAKKLTASWFAYKAPHLSETTHKKHAPLPRIFVSEIQVEKLSPASQTVIRKYLDGLCLSPAQVAVALTCGTVPWGPVTREDYDALLKESDYAAWVMVHGYALNHTALSAHAMRTPNGQPLRLEEAARLVTAHGLTLNQDGGEIKVSPDGLLRQCSSMSDWVPAGFAGQPRSDAKVPGSYLELVERLPLPQYAHMKAEELEEAQRRDGFEVGNADRLFTSTRTTA